MTVNLDEPILFGMTRRIRGGRAVDVPVSLERALTTPLHGGLTGDCKHICAAIVFDRATGTDRVAFTSDIGLQSVSGFGVLKAEIPTLLPSWSKRAGARGTDVSPSRGTMRGNIVTFTTSSFCVVTSPARGPEDCVAVNGEPQQLPIPCYHYPYGLDCIYCGSKHDQDCTIENENQSQEPVCNSFADALGPMEARIPVWSPGALVIPDDGFWDIHGDATPFNANGPTLDGLVRYYLKGLRGRVDPVLPNEADWFRCCTWLCNWTQTGDPQFAWRVFCNEPFQTPWYSPPIDEKLPRPIAFAWFPGVYSLIHFNFDPLAPCFPLADQFCLTYGRGDAVWWSHLTEPDTRVSALDHVGIDLSRMAFSTDQAAHPYAEPETVAIINDALWETSRHVWQIGQNDPNQGHQRHSNYNSYGLNLWSHNSGFGDCGVKHPVCHKDDPGTKRTVYVTPYGTSCRLPADLVLDRMSIQLRVSFEPRNVTRAGSSTPLPFGVRLPATCDVYVWLLARLRPGWESIDCPVTFPWAAADACNLGTSPSVPVVVSADGCSQVPLVIHWRGINGPPPWSRATFEHRIFVHNARACCEYLCALDGLVIPAEVRNTADPAGPQPYEGDVVITMNTDLTELGCDCRPG